MIFSICIILFFIIYFLLYLYEINPAFKKVEIMNPIDISEYIIQYACIKLHKMVDVNNIMSILFISQGVFLSKFNNPLFEEDFVLWHTGPILESVYKHYKIYCYMYIPISDYMRKNECTLPVVLSKEKINTLNYIIEKMVGLNGWKSLEALSKIEPCYRKYGSLNKTIAKEDIKNYYKEILNGW